MSKDKKKGLGPVSLGGALYNPPEITPIDEGLLLSEEELTETAEVLFNFCSAMDIEGIKSVLWQGAKAQLAHCQPIIEARKDAECEKRVGEIFEEIERRATFVVAEPDKVLLKHIDKPNAILLSIQDLEALQGKGEGRWYKRMKSVIS